MLLVFFLGPGFTRVFFFVALMKYQSLQAMNIEHWLQFCVFSCSFFSVPLCSHRKTNSILCVRQRLNTATIHQQSKWSRREINCHVPLGWIFSFLFFPRWCCWVNCFLFCLTMPRFVYFISDWITCKPISWNKYREWLKLHCQRISLIGNRNN